MPIIVPKDAVVMSHVYRVMGRIRPTPRDDALFVVHAMEWLSKKLGDIHVEYHADSGWACATCYEEETGWKEWLHDKKLIGVLIKAVLKLENCTSLFKPLTVINANRDGSVIPDMPKDPDA